MKYRYFLAVVCVVLILAPCAFTPHRAVAQSRNDPPTNITKLLRVLNNEGFDARQGQFRILDPVTMACTDRGDGKPFIPSTWYNNVQPYMSIILPGYVWDTVPWEQTRRAIPVNYLLRQDEAILIVGNTPPPMAYYSWAVSSVRTRRRWLTLATP